MMKTTLRSKLVMASALGGAIVLGGVAAVPATASDHVGRYSVDFFDATLLPDGAVSLPITFSCDSGKNYFLGAALSQDNIRSHAGIAGGECTGDQQDTSIVVASQEAAFEQGEAEGRVALHVDDKVLVRVKPITIN